MKYISALLVVGLAAARLSVMAAEKKMDISKIDISKLPPVADTKGVTYARDIRPIFEASCFRCHGEEKQKGELRLDSLEAVLKGGGDGKVVVPGDSKKSVLVVAVAQLDEEITMPPKRRPGGPGGQGGQFRGGPGNRPPGGGENSGGPGAGAPRQRPGGAGGPGGGFGPPAKPLTTEQVGLIRAWVDQGAK